jgi:hypothetical protein
VTAPVTQTAELLAGTQTLSRFTRPVTQPLLAVTQALATVTARLPQTLSTLTAPSTQSLVSAIGTPAPITRISGSAAASPFTGTLNPIAQTAPTLPRAVQVSPREEPVASMLTAVGQTLAPVARARSFGVWATQLGSSIARLGMSPLLSGADGFFAGGQSLAGRSSVVAPAPGTSSPVPPGVQSGGGIGSVAGGGSGFFFGAAALLALAALSLPRVICTLRMFGASRAPQPFVLLLERPG